MNKPSCAIDFNPGQRIPWEIGNSTCGLNFFMNQEFSWVDGEYWSLEKIEKIYISIFLIRLELSIVRLTSVFWKQIRFPGVLEFINKNIYNTQNMLPRIPGLYFWLWLFRFQSQKVELLIPTAFCIMSLRSVEMLEYSRDSSISWTSRYNRNMGQQDILLPLFPLEVVKF